MRYLPKLAVFFAVAILIVVIDQVSKWYLPQLSLNLGVSFGLASGWGSVPLASSILLTALSIWLTMTAYRASWPWWGWGAAGLVVGGGASNVLDRWWFGAVRDPLPIPLTPLHNNLADYGIFIGLCLVFFVITWHKPALRRAKTHD